jgi:hypothetical protein
MNKLHPSLVKSANSSWIFETSPFWQAHEVSKPDNRKNRRPAHNLCWNLVFMVRAVGTMHRHQTKHSTQECFDLNKSTRMKNTYFHPRALTCLRL